MGARALEFEPTSPTASKSNDQVTGHRHTHTQFCHAHAPTSRPVVHVQSLKSISYSKYYTFFTMLIGILCAGILLMYKNQSINLYHY